MRTVTLYRLSGLAVLIGMTISGIASVLYSRAGGIALYRDPLVPVDDLAKLFGSLIFLIGLPGLYAFQASRAGRLGLARPHTGCRTGPARACVRPEAYGPPPPVACGRGHKSFLGWSFSRVPCSACSAWPSPDELTHVVQGLVVSGSVI